MGVIIEIFDKKYQKKYYMEWSTTLSAPLTYGLSLTEFKKYYKNHYRGNCSDLDDRLSRVKEHKTSEYPPMNDLKGLLKCNRAGKNGEYLTQEKILERFCRNRIE